MDDAAVLEALLSPPGTSGRRCLAVSPHLDDAVLSAGGWLSEFARHGEVTVLTVFTAALPPPHSWIARRFVRGSGFADGEALFRARRAEDAAVLQELGLEPVHLGLPDAVFRRVPAPGGRSRPAYPTLRLDALRGRVARSDRALGPDLAARLAGVLRASAPDVVVAPIGIGRHVDHLLVRDAVRTAVRQVQDDAPGSGPELLLVSDQPYASRTGPDARLVESLGLEPHSWRRGRERAVAAAAGYASQIPVLFPGARIPADPEVFWVARTAQPAR